MRKKWTEEEDAILKEHWPKGGYAAVKDFFPGRTYNSVKSRVKKHSIIFDDRWKDWEVAILKEYYPKWGARKCREMLPHRNIPAIQKHCQSIQVKCDMVEQRINLGMRKPDLPRGFYKDTQGYIVYTPDDKNRNSILYHRYVMEQHLGRKLRTEEIVHHKDRNKENNDLSNLELTTRSEHAKIHEQEIAETLKKWRNERK